MTNVNVALAGEKWNPINWFSDILRHFVLPEGLLERERKVCRLRIENNICMKLINFVENTLEKKE